MKKVRGKEQEKEQKSRQERLPQNCYKGADGGNPRREPLGSLFRGDVGGNRIHADECLSGDFGAWCGDPKVLLDTYSQLKRVDGVEGQTFRAEERGVITNIFRRNFQHEVFDHHVLDAGFEIIFRHVTGRK